MVSWEYPPRIVGGIASHCAGLAEALVKNGVETHVVTLEFPGASAFEDYKGIKIHRAQISVGHPNFMTWILLFNHFLEKKIAELSHTSSFDLVHIHDWLVAPAGIAAKFFLGKPLLTTLHSTENGRSGLHTPDAYMIDGVEWWSAYEAKKIIVTSNSMKHEVCGHFHVPWEKVDIIPNGIDVSKFDVNVDRNAVRSRFGVAPHEKLILYVGRLVPQKGVEYLIHAAPMIVSRYHDTRFIIVGEGWMRDYLQGLANASGYGWKINFTGFLPDPEMVALMKSADVLVVPSIYEPFGIVPLEGMAAGVPVVASQVGGMAEIIEHDKTGVYVYPRSPESIAWGVTHLLFNQSHAQWIVQNALNAARNIYSWDAIAKKTLQVYEGVMET